MTAMAGTRAWKTALDQLLSTRVELLCGTISRASRTLVICPLYMKLLWVRLLLVTTSVPSARATVGADEGAPISNTITEPISTGATTLATVRTMEIKRRPEDASMSRPSSLHQDVLDVGWRDIQIGGAEEAAKSNEPSVSAMSDVHERLYGYTGAWP